MIKGKDTVFSASDGGFFFGKGTYTKKGSKIFVAGKYAKLSYTKTGGDSTFKDTISDGGPKIMIGSRGNPYNRTDPAMIEERWQIQLK